MKSRTSDLKSQTSEKSEFSSWPFQCNVTLKSSASFQQKKDLPKSQRIGRAFLFEFYTCTPLSGIKGNILIGCMITLGGGVT